MMATIITLAGNKVMGTQVKVIVTRDKVFATYVETICFEQKFSNEDDKMEAIDRAKVSAFNYAVSFGSVILEIVHLDEIGVSDNIFKYLSLKI